MRTRSAGVATRPDSPDDDDAPEEMSLATGHEAAKEQLEGERGAVAEQRRAAKERRRRRAAQGEGEAAGPAGGQRLPGPALAALRFSRSIRPVHTVCPAQASKPATSRPKQSQGWRAALPAWARPMSWPCCPRTSLRPWPRHGGALPAQRRTRKRPS